MKQLKIFIRLVDELSLEQAAATRTKCLIGERNSEVTRKIVSPKQGGHIRRCWWNGITPWWNFAYLQYLWLKINSYTTATGINIAINDVLILFFYLSGHGTKVRPCHADAYMPAYLHLLGSHMPFPIKNIVYFPIWSQSRLNDIEAVLYARGETRPRFRTARESNQPPLCDTSWKEKTTIPSKITLRIDERATSEWIV